MSEMEPDDDATVERSNPRVSRQTRRLLVLVAALAVAVAVVAATVFGGDGDDDADDDASADPTQVMQLAQNVPAPEFCRVAPRSVTELQGLVASPSASPSASIATPAPSSGTPADPATIEAIVDVYREAVACQNGGDFARAYAFFTDAYVRRILEGASAHTGVDPSLVAIVIGTPAPSLPMSWTAIVARGSVQLLPDGRASAVFVEVKVQDADNPNAARPKLVIFVNENGRWLIDGISNPAPEATPAATP